MAKAFRKWCFCKESGIAIDISVSASVVKIVASIENIYIVGLAKGFFFLFTVREAGQKGLFPLVDSGLKEKVRS